MNFVELNHILARSNAMTHTKEIKGDGKGNKVVSFKVGANDFTVFSGNDKQFIVAKGAVTYVIEDPQLVAGILAKYPPTKN